MIDKKKLLAFLRLQRAPDYPQIITNGSQSVPDNSLDAEMDRYDLTKQPPRQFMLDGLGGFDCAVNSPGTVYWTTPQTTTPQTTTPQTIQYGYFYPTYGQVARPPLDEFQVKGFPMPADYQAAEQEGKKRKYQAFVDRIQLLSEAPAQRIAPPPKRSPDYIACLTGWRAWGASKGKLESLGTDTWWQPKKAERAYCTHFEHEEDGSPSKTCQCGWWSFKSMSLMNRALESYLDSVAVVGIVDVWGKVIECENGYRSEFAYPRELWLLKDNLDWLSYTYGVPVRKL